MLADYGGTRFGRQELDGELIDDVDGRAVDAGADREMSRAGAGGAGAGGGGRRSAGFGRRRRMRDRGLRARARTGPAMCLAIIRSAGFRPRAGRAPWSRRPRRGAPTGWSPRPTRAGRWWRACCRSVDAALPVRGVKARFGKGLRADPVRARFEAGKAKFAGAFPELEDQLCGLTLAGYEGPGRSPDRADAMVWALADLLLGKERRPACQEALSRNPTGGKLERDMKWFGRKAARAAGRPFLLAGWRHAFAAEPWPRSYEAQVREAYLGNPVAQRACGWWRRAWPGRRSMPMRRGRRRRRW